MLHPLLQQQYELHRKRLEQCCERPVEPVLYHGTAVPTVPDICTHGFNRSFCGRNGEAWVPAGAEALLPGTTLTAPSNPVHYPPQVRSMDRACTLPSVPPCRCWTATRPPMPRVTRQCSWHGC